MPEGAQPAGWTNFGGMAKKFHWLPSDSDRALCGKWGLGFAATRAQVDLQPDTGPSPDDCVACRRKLDKTYKARAKR